MRKIILVVLIIILFGFISSFFYWYSLTKKTAEIQEKVLSSLTEELEFCEIIKSDTTREQGEFWLICNGRPFYAQYLKGDLNYELNGWGWLKNTEYWSELENCDFYNSEKIGDNYQLTFYCPKDFQAAELKAKVYEFNPTSVKIKKIEEKNFLEIIDKDIKLVYLFLEDCQIKDFSSESEWGPPGLFLTYSCQDGQWLVLASGAMFLWPPVWMKEELSYIQKAEASFERVFDCNADNISSLDGSVLISSICKNKELVIKYDFLSYDQPIAEYAIECKEPCLEYGKYFLLPPLKEFKEAAFVMKKINQTPIGLIYKVDGNIISIGIVENKIVSFWRKHEGFYP